MKQTETVWTCVMKREWMGEKIHELYVEDKWNRSKPKKTLKEDKEKDHQTTKQGGWCQPQLMKKINDRH